MKPLLLFVFSLFSFAGIAQKNDSIQAVELEKKLEQFSPKLEHYINAMAVENNSDALRTLGKSLSDTSRNLLTELRELGFDFTDYLGQHTMDLVLALNQPENSAFYMANAQESLNQHLSQRIPKSVQLLSKIQQQAEHISSSRNTKRLHKRIQTLQDLYRQYSQL